MALSLPYESIFMSLSNDKIFDGSKSKAFEDDRMRVSEKLKYEG